MIRLGSFLEGDTVDATSTEMVIMTLQIVEALHRMNEHPEMCGVSFNKNHERRTYIDQALVYLIVQLQHARIQHGFKILPIVDQNLCRIVARGEISSDGYLFWKRVRGAIEKHRDEYNAASPVKRTALSLHQWIVATCDTRCGRRDESGTGTVDLEATQSGSRANAQVMSDLHMRMMQEKDEQIQALERQVRTLQADNTDLACSLATSHKISRRDLRSFMTLLANYPELPRDTVDRLLGSRVFQTKFMTQDGSTKRKRSARD